MKNLFFSFILLLPISVLSFEVQYELPSYPNRDQISAFKNEDGVSFKFCCYYPSKSEVLVLNSISPGHIHIKAGFFPSMSEIEALNQITGGYSIEVSEVFPGPEDYSNINNSNIKELIINSSDFITKGEAVAFNGFDVNVRLNINHKEYPLPRHMKILRLLNKNITIGFKNDVPPGIGYANFFNNLNLKKVFNITNKFPYGDDAIGINGLTQSRIEISPEERLMPQDLPVLNDIKLDKNIYLKDQRPYTNELIQRINSINASNIYIDVFKEDIKNPILQNLKYGQSKVILINK